MSKIEELQESLNKHKDKKDIMIFFRLGDSKDVMRIIFNELKRRIELGESLDGISLPEDGDGSSHVSLFMNYSEQFKKKE